MSRCYEFEFLKGNYIIIMEKENEFKNNMIYFNF